MLARQTTEARAVLRELLIDRVLYTPTARKGGGRCDGDAARRTDGPGLALLEEPEQHRPDRAILEPGSKPPRSSS